MDIEQIDEAIERAVHDFYNGYRIVWYASGYDTGACEREILYDVFLKDGSRFIAQGKWDCQSERVTITEREYIDYSKSK